MREDNCDSPGKHPRLPRGLKEASTDPASIREWWGRWPDANVSVLCGMDSKLLNLDFDVKKGGKGVRPTRTYKKHTVR